MEIEEFTHAIKNIAGFESVMVLSNDTPLACGMYKVLSDDNSKSAA